VVSGRLWIAVWHGYVSVCPLRCIGCNLFEILWFWQRGSSGFFGFGVVVCMVCMLCCFTSVWTFSVLLWHSDVFPRNDSCNELLVFHCGSCGSLFLFVFAFVWGICVYKILFCFILFWKGVVVLWAVTPFPDLCVFPMAI